MQEQEKQTITQEEIKKLEENAVEKFETPNKTGKNVTCYDCGKFYGLYLITEERPTRKFKTSSKKNRNRVPLLTPDGNKVYLDRECINKRVKKSKSA
jgi:hypothetical protein